MIFWSFVKIFGDCFYVSKLWKICIRDLAKWWGKSLKSLFTVLRPGWYIDWISVDFSGRKKHVKRKLNVRKKNLKANMLFLGSRWFSWKRNAETSWNIINSSKSRYSHDIPMTWRWRRLFYMTNDRCWGEAATKFRVTVELWAKRVKLPTRGFC